MLLLLHQLYKRLCRRLCGLTVPVKDSWAERDVLLFIYFVFLGLGCGYGEAASARIIGSTQETGQGRVNGQGKKGQGRVNGQGNMLGLVTLITCGGAQGRCTYVRRFVGGVAARGKSRR